MKIAIIIDTLRSGGKERRLVELIKGLYKDYNVSIELILLSKIIHYHEILELGINIHYLVRRWNKDPVIFHKFYRICKNSNPDIIQSWDSMSSVYSAPIARLLGVKFVNSMIYDAPIPLRIFSSKWLRSKITFPISNAITGNSKAGLLAYHATPSKSFLIYNGFDFQRLENLGNIENIKSKFNISTEKIVGMVASFSHHKDHLTFINAAKSILYKRNDVTFICIGGVQGNRRNEVEAMINSSQKDKIILAKAQHPIEPIINMFTIGILSTFTEGISNAIIEYMALGKPVIATDGGGTSELVIDGETGFLIDQEDPKGLEERIIFLLDNPETAFMMGQKGKARIKEHFGLPKMTRHFNRLYKQLLS